MASLSITLISATDVQARNVLLTASLSGDESDDKQRTPVHKKGSTANTWEGHPFNFAVREAAPLGTHLKFKIEKKEPFLNPLFCFKKGSFFGRKTAYVVGEVDVRVEDLRPDGSAGDMNPKELSCEVRSSSLKTVAVLKFSYQFGAPPEREEQTVTASQAAASPSPRCSIWNCMEKVAITVAANEITSALKNLVPDCGDCTDA